MTKSNSKWVFFSNSLLVKQVILMAFVLSVLVFTVCATYHSYRIYTDGQATIIADINYMEKVIAIPLKSALWGMDRESSEEILKVLVQNPHVAKAWIENAEVGETAFSSGRPADWVTLSYPIVHRQSSPKEEILGTLKLSLSKEAFNRTLKENIIYSSVHNLSYFTFLAFCIVLLFNKKIIDPLRKIQLMTKKFNQEHLSPILGESLNRSSLYSKKENEMDSLYREIHLLQENFKSAFELQQKEEAARYEAELQLEKEKQKLVLAQRLDTIGQITTQVAHDFGNLIMIINGKTKNLDKRLTDETDLLQTESIRKATSRAHDLVKKILSMTRSEKTEPTIFDPFKSLLEIQDLLKISVGGEIVLNIESDANPKLIYAEPSSFENVIINLCVNARDAMPGGGTIGISLKSSYKDNQEVVALSIQDSGDGIPEDIQIKIFDPFFTTKESGKGTGLGLSQVQDFIKSVGGSLELNSGKTGSCFTLYLPNKATKGEVELSSAA